MSQYEPLTESERGRLEAAERMIDAVISGDVQLGVKAKQFFGEYRYSHPKAPEPNCETCFQNENLEGYPDPECPECKGAGYVTT